MAVLWVEQRRGFALEGEHAIDAVVCDRAGKVLQRVGEDRVTTFRSAAKPFQLEATVGLLSESTRATLTSRDLALGAASHHGEPQHVAHVEGLLRKLGRAPSNLLCGAHAPSHAASAEALFARGERPSALHNNCSGKHSFMAAACATHGFAEDYRPAEHPLQQRILQVVQEHSGQGVKGTVIDGCGIPCFVLPLSAMARAWAALADAMNGRSADLLGHIGLAMRENPILMSGSEAFDGWLIENAPVVAKVGAQGLLCVALPEQGVGIAIRARSGHDAIRPAAALAVLAHAYPGLVKTTVPERFTSVYNASGARVGEHVAVWR